MKQLDLVNEFREELARVSREVDISSGMGHFDIHKVSEDLICGLLKSLFDLPGLRNLNESDRKNFPGINLVDDSERIAVQVTADNSSSKIKDSITKLRSHNLHRDYDRL